MLSRDAFHRARAQLHFARGDGARAHRHLAKCGFSIPLEGAFDRVVFMEQSFVEGLMPQTPQGGDTKPPNRIIDAPADVTDLLQSSPFVFFNPRSPLLPLSRSSNKCCMGPDLWANEPRWSETLQWQMREHAARHWREVLKYVILKMETLSQDQRDTYARAAELLRRIESAAAHAATAGHDTTADTWGLGVALFRHTHPSFEEPHAQAKLCIHDPRTLVDALERNLPADAYDYASALDAYAGLTNAMLVGMQGITEIHRGEGYTLIR